MCCSVVVGVMFKLNEFMGLHQDSQRNIFLKTADLQRENRSLTVKVKITTFSCSVKHTGSVSFIYHFVP
jgi:hypothetical protein